MAAATNIPVGVNIADLLAGFKLAGQTTSQFTSQFRQQFDGLKGSADAPVGALASVARQLTIAKRQIGDMIAAGAPIPAELATKFTLLKGTVDAVKNAFADPVKLGPFEALNQRLAETKTRMQDILAEGGKVPAELTAKYQGLENQVEAVSRAFDKVPTRVERIVATGSRLQSFGQNMSTYVTAPLLLAGGAAFNAYADIDSMVKGLKVTSGSLAGANAQFKDFYKLSQNPGLGLDQTVQAGLQLETLGYQAQTAKKYIGEVGNAIALGGKGKVEFGSVITQFTQMAGKAKVLGDDLKPIVNASPVIAKAINNIFGTVDSEAISKKLQAAGKGPRDFIETLVNELSKLERVGGGPRNAVENFGDAAKIASYNVAGAADKIFDLTGKLNGFAGLIGQGAEGFAAMSSTGQGTILTLAGILTAIGPVTFGLGTLARFGPTIASTFTSGFSAIRTGLMALVSPIGLVTAAVAVLGYSVYSIYSFNQATKASVTAAGLMNSAYKESTAAIAGEQAQLSALVATAKNEKIGKEARLTAIKQINAISPKYLGDLNLETIGTQKATNALAQYVKVLELKARAQIYQDRIAQSSVKLSDLQGKTAESFVDTGDAWAATLGGVANSIFGGPSGKELLLKKAKERKDQMVKDAELTLKVSRSELEKAVADLGKSGESIAVKGPGIDFKNGGLGGDSDLKQAKDRLKKLKEEIFADQQKGLDVSDKIAQAKELKAQIDAAGSAFKKTKQEAQHYASVLTVLERAQKRIVDEIQQKRSLGIEVPASLYFELSRVGAQIKQIKGEIDKPLKPTGLSAIDANYRDGSDRTGRLLDGLRSKISSIPTLFTDQIAKIQASIRNSTLLGEAIPDSTIQSLAIYTKTVDDLGRAEQNATAKAARLAEGLRLSSLPKLADIKIGGFNLKLFDDSANTLEQRVSTMGQSIGGALKNAAAQAAEGMGELIGGLLSGTASLADIPAMIGSVFANLAKTMGQSLIAFGTAGIALQAFQTNPAGALVAGIALTALGSALSSTIKSQASGAGIRKFAKGGALRQPTVGLMAEYPSAQTYNPEIVSPKAMMADTFRQELSRYGGSPFNQLQNAYANGAGGSTHTVQVEINGRVRGNDLDLVGKRTVQLNKQFNSSAR